MTEPAVLTKEELERLEFEAWYQEHCVDHTQDDHAEPVVQTPNEETEIPRLSPE